MKKVICRMKKIIHRMKKMISRMKKFIQRMTFFIPYDFFHMGQIANECTQCPKLLKSSYRGQGLLGVRGRRLWLGPFRCCQWSAGLSDSGSLCAGVPILVHWKKISNEKFFKPLVSPNHPEFM